MSSYYCLTNREEECVQTSREDKMQQVCSRMKWHQMALHQLKQNRIEAVRNQVGWLDKGTETVEIKDIFSQEKIKKG